MSWNKLHDGRLAVMDDNGVWWDYTALPVAEFLPELDPTCSNGWRTYQYLIKNRWVLVNKEDY